MWTMTERMQRTLKASHVVRTRVDVLSGATTLATLDTLIDGSVTVDRAGIQRRATIQFVDLDGTLTPDEARDLLSPLSSNDLRVWRGVKFTDGTEELVPLGTLRIAKSVSRWPSVTVDAYDWAWVVGRNRWGYDYTIAAGTNYIDAIRNLVTERFPSVETNFPTTSHTTPLIVVEGQADPWESAQNMAESLGMRLFFNPLGVCTLIDEPDLSTAQPVWTYAEGADSVLLELEREFDIEQTYNGVVAAAESTSIPTPIRAVVWDDDETSPTFYQGRFGKVPMFFVSPLLTTQAMCQSAAESLLRKQLGMTENVGFEGLVNPAHELMDVVLITRERVGLSDSLHVLDNFTVPLRASTPMTATTRSRQAFQPSTST